MKKFFLTILLLTALVCACTCTAVTASAESANDVKIGVNQTRSGNELTFEAYVSKNDGFITLFLCVEFDHDTLDLASVQFGDVYSKMKYFDNVEEVQSGKDKVLMIGYAGEGENHTDLGSLFTLHFSLKNKAVNGKHKIRLSVAEVGYKKSGASSEIVYNAKYGENGVDLLNFDRQQMLGEVVAESEFNVENGVPAPEKGGNRALVISLAVIGSVIFVAGLCLAAYFIFKKKQNKPIDPTQKTENGNGKND